jgi:hypothetical protein
MLPLMQAVKWRADELACKPDPVGSSSPKLLIQNQMFGGRRTAGQSLRSESLLTYISRYINGKLADATGYPLPAPPCSRPTR